MSKTNQSAAATGCSKHIKSEVKSKGKWIAMNVITYQDPTGQERTWEGISRTTKKGTEADAVGVITVFEDPKSKSERVVLVRQYRPPMEAYTVEFPAGLIDVGETAEQAAVREMREETGLIVKAKFVSPATSLDPGIGNTTIKFVTCEVDMHDVGNTKPQPAEFTEVIIQPLNTLLSKLAEFSKAKDVVDSRLYTWAIAKCG
ncbi:ADP-sugar pyrophosphatase [Plakobranchus ocellatus]|uniref:ADP-sugar pyrophosphatase n=1 Tax=Plakobranchus ocellatus TaxID=259542 RepID=A0AAV3Y3Z2_9GAST|nr:ADP-sugar pyrophosphatase [Plakobranchus ocellatus]